MIPVVIGVSFSLFTILLLWLCEVIVGNEIIYLEYE